MHAKPDLRVLFLLASLSFRLGDRGRYPAFGKTKATPMNQKKLQVLFVSLIFLIYSGCYGTGNEGDLANSVNSSEPDNPNASTTAEMAPRERSQILGTWKVLTIETDGEVVERETPAKYVFTETTMNASGVPFIYRVPNSANPASLDFTHVLPFSKFHPAIYKIQNDVLTLCYATKAGSIRPTEFATKPGDGNQTVTCRRAASPAKFQPEKEINAELANAIREAIDLLENNKIDEYLSRFAPLGILPDKDSDEWETMAEYVESERGAFSKTFRALTKLPATPESTDTEVTFDLSAVSIEGGVSFPEIGFTKRSGQWRLLLN